MRFLQLALNSCKFRGDADSKGFGELEEYATRL